MANRSLWTVLAMAFVAIILSMLLSVNYHSMKKKNASSSTTPAPAPVKYIHTREQQPGR